MKVTITKDAKGTTAVAVPEPVTVLQAIRSPKTGGKPS